MRFLFRFFLLLCCNIPCLLSTQGQSDQTVEVGIILDTDLAELGTLVDNIELEINTLLGSRYDFNFQRFYRDHLVRDPEIAKEVLQQVLTDPSVDLVVGAGIAISAIMAEQAPFAKPVFATAVLDPVFQGIQYTDKGSSGFENFTYMVLPTDFYRDMEVFYQIYPFKHLTLFLDEYIWQRTQQNPSSRFQEFLAERNATFQVIPVKEDSQQPMAMLDTSTDAVYYGPLIGLDSDGVNQLIDQVNELKLPSFAYFGASAVQRGVLAGQAPERQINRIARRLALTIERYLDGEDLSDMPVDLSYQELLTINMATARQIGFSPGWDFLRSATLINEEVLNIARKLALGSAIEEALRVNWPLAVAGKSLEIAEQEVKESRSGLLPQLDLSATSSVIDEDRAAASFGSQAEWTTLGSGNFSQLIFSEGASANYKVSQRLRDATFYNREITELDVILETVDAYLSILVAKTVERIQKENIRLNRVNLQLAKVRQEVGYSGPSDLYRWQSNIALANIELNNVQANRRTAEINMNRILNRPLDELFETVETDIEDPSLITNDPRLDSYVGNPEDLRKFTAFMVRMGLDSLPELKELDAQIAAQERLVKLSRRSFFLPDIGISAGADYRLHRAGAGSDPLPPDSGFPSVDDVTWQLGLSASVPLITGGKRNAVYQKNLITLEQLQFQKYDLTNQLEQRIRASMEQVGASYANIQLSNDAREASLKNFELIQESYQQGTVSVINLLDAQNAAVESALNAANAGYQFIIDLLTVDRAIGKYYSLSTDLEREEYFNKLEEFVSQYQK